MSNCQKNKNIFLDCSSGVYRYLRNYTYFLIKHIRLTKIEVWNKMKLQRKFFSNLRIKIVTNVTGIVKVLHLLVVFIKCIINALFYKMDSICNYTILRQHLPAWFQSDRINFLPSITNNNLELFLKNVYEEYSKTSF